MTEPFDRTRPGRPPLAFPFGDWGQELSPRYAHLRAARAPLHPVVTVTGDRVWLATRYDVVRRLLAEPGLSMAAALEPDAPRQEPVPLRAEGGSGDSVTRLREVGLHKLMADALGLRAVRRHEEWTRGQAEDTMAELIAHGPPADLYPALAVRLPFAVACRVLLGPLEVDARERLDAWCDTILTWRGPTRQEQTAAINAVHRFFLDRLPHLCDAPGEHLVKRLAQADGEGRLRPDDLAELATSFFIAGYRTSSSFLANALVTLARHPEALAALRADPALVPAAVEELLRHTPMATGGAKRVATRDVEIDGMTVRAGECVLLSLESANHDPAAFPDPDSFVPSRADGPHLGFSHGKHHCPGNRLARMQLGAVVGVLAGRAAPEVRLAVPADRVRWRRDVAFRVPEGVPVTW
ncbi:cytochrome P450 [Streptomyces sulfonofaciens]|uniref:Cytochrome P450 n=1 Tax=Streptomyces sulfonofaciens TaxID=68272 RepID=A0A919L3M0_9ACTN|nr:cytochrome P450 [Streptomyces sulfonofaciens]GHH82194.1 cytochrome P450 [Streptomyces sulfonofaciens]